MKRVGEIKNSLSLFLLFSIFMSEALGCKTEVDQFLPVSSTKLFLYCIVFCIEENSV